MSWAPISVIIWLPQRVLGVTSVWIYVWSWVRTIHSVWALHSKHTVINSIRMVMWCLMTVRNGRMDVLVYSRGTVLLSAIHLIMIRGKSGKRNWAVPAIPIRRKKTKRPLKKEKARKTVPMIPVFLRKKLKKPLSIPTAIRYSKCRGLWTLIIVLIYLRIPQSPSTGKRCVIPIAILITWALPAI